MRNSGREGMCVDCGRVCNGCAQQIECEVYVRECTFQQRNCTDQRIKTEVSALYEREVSVRCDRVVTERMCADNGQEIKCTDNGSGCAV